MPYSKGSKSKGCLIHCDDKKKRTHNFSSIQSVGIYPMEKVQNQRGCLIHAVDLYMSIYGNIVSLCNIVANSTTKQQAAVTTSTVTLTQTHLYLLISKQ